MASTREEPVFDVVSPLGRGHSATGIERKVLATLQGKTLGFIWDYLFKGDEMFKAIERAVSRQFQDARFVDYPRFREHPRRLAGRESEHRGDRRTNPRGERRRRGGRGRCLRKLYARRDAACAAVENAGVPAVAIGGAGFEAMGHAIARGLGISHVPIVSYPGPILADSPEHFAEKSQLVATEVVAELTVKEITTPMTTPTRMTPPATSRARPSPPGSLVVTTCHRVVVMDQGRHLAEGTPAEILANDDVTRAYLGEKAHDAATGFLHEGS